MSYQGPELLRIPVRWFGLRLFDRAETISLLAINGTNFSEISRKDIAALKQLRTIETTGDVDDCKLLLANLVPQHRLSHFELGQDRCTAILK